MTALRVRLAILSVAWGVLQSAALGGQGAPEVVRCWTVAPGVLALRIDAGRMVYGRQSPYVKRPGDEVEQRGKKKQRWVKRGGRTIGSLVGPNDGILYTLDRVAGEKLDTAWAARPESYSISSPDDPRYRKAVRPTAVYRKSKPTAMARTDEWKFDFPVTHVLYLMLPEPLTAGRRYVLSFGGGRPPSLKLRRAWPDEALAKAGRLEDYRFRHEPAKTRSEAVHVSHLGFRPDDPVKVAYLSCWMGDGGGVKYRAGTRFEVLDDRTGRVVFEGEIQLSKAAGDRTEDPYKRNYNLADVYRMDFSGLTRPGKYRVHVHGVGCSYPFEIAPDVWQKAFLVAAKGFYHQRSGIALGPPYTDFTRPRCFHPDDGVRVYHSNCPLMDSGNGLNARGTDKGNFGNLVAGKTDEIVPNAWGGYFDAGDWDRRVQHLRATRLLLELADLFPDYVETVRLNIPESGAGPDLRDVRPPGAGPDLREVRPSGDGLPDVVSEALWNLDFFRRMQTPDGGIRGGIESEEHPRHGEGSWQEQLRVFAYAPGMWSSFVYAGVAARVAGRLKTLRPDLASPYEESAFRAMAYAEDKLANHDYAKLPHQVTDARNLAAAELYRLTGEERWHDIFFSSTVFRDANSVLAKWKHHEQRDAAFVYIRSDRPEVDEEIRRNARAALLREADESVRQGERTAFNWTKLDPWIPVGWGVLGTPQVKDILRAHFVTGDGKYLRAAILACQTGAGANPVNMCYTTGVGHHWPRNPLWIDSRVQAEPPPPGLTVYGPFDMVRNKDYWVLKVMAPAIHPSKEAWPTIEAYFDVTLFPPVTEFTVMQTLGPNTYAWGYLAARGNETRARSRAPARAFR